MATVKVRVAVAVNVTGSWYACGQYNLDPHISMADAQAEFDYEGIGYWLEADLPVPEIQIPPVVRAKATKKES